MGNTKIEKKQAPTVNYSMIEKKDAKTKAAEDRKAHLATTGIFEPKKGEINKYTQVDANNKPFVKKEFVGPVGDVLVSEDGKKYIAEKKDSPPWASRTKSDYVVDYTELGGEPSHRTLIKEGKHVSDLEKFAKANGKAIKNDFDVYNYYPYVNESKTFYNKQGEETYKELTKVDKNGNVTQMSYIDETKNEYITNKMEYSGKKMTKYTSYYENGKKEAEFTYDKKDNEYGKWYDKNGKLTSTRYTKAHGPED